MAAASGVKAAADAAAQARAEMDAVEDELASGGHNVTAEKLHKLRDRWRHATLSAQGAQARAEREQHQARLDGLAAIGAEVDKLAATDPAGPLAAALQDVATAVGRVWQLAAAHDAAVAELVAAAQDLAVEPAAPGGPRRTSAHLAVHDRAIAHKATKVAPVRDQIGAALSRVLAGDVDRAVAELRPVTTTPEPNRPDHLLLNRSGALLALSGPLSAAIENQVKSGELTMLTKHDIDLFMAGELG